MVVAGSSPQESGASGGERLARASLGGLGMAMCAGPPVATAILGWTAAALAPLVPVGALFVILAAFYRRGAGEIRFPTIRLSIESSGHDRAAPYTPELTPVPETAVTAEAARQQRPTRARNAAPS